MNSLDETQERALGAAGRLAPETVGTLEALGRVLAVDVLSDLDVPPFDTAAADGFALRSSDVAGADAEAPATLSVVVAMPDLRKGERLILVTPDKDLTRSKFQQYARAKGATELMVPADVINASVPVLGSGKADYVAATAMVKERLGGAKAA